MRTAFHNNNALASALVDVRGIDSLEGVLEAADLNYQVGLQELYSSVLLPDGVSTVKYNHYGVVRMDNLAPLGVVGERYTPIQNSDAFEPLQYLKDEGFIEEFEQAGIVGDGQRAFIIARLAQAITLTDQHTARVLFSTTHDGSGSYSVRAIAERLHCRNQIPRLSSLGTRITAIKHTQSATRRVQHVRAQVLNEVRWFDEYTEQYSLMMDTYIEQGELAQFMDVIAPDLPRTATLRQVKAQEKKREQILARIFGPANDNIRGSIAALFQGAVEYADYDSRGNNAERILLGRDVKFKQRAWNAALALL